jgi:hypothetical protein
MEEEKRQKKAAIDMAMVVGFFIILIEESAKFEVFI